MHTKKEVFQNNDKVLLHYYPGNHSAPTQATQYVTPGEKIKLPTGELASTKRIGIPLFDSKHFYFPHMEEIELSHSNTWKTKILHTLKGIPTNIKHWWNSISVEKGDKDDINRNTYQSFVVNSSKASLGQRTDINEFFNSNNDIEKSPELATLARAYMGVSRGAGATFSALSEVPISQNIKLCILEAPPSTLKGLFKFYGERYLKSRAIGKWLYENLPNFLLTPFLGAQHQRDKASQARGHVDRFPNTIPLLIISSKKDTTVAHESSIRLAFRVAEKRNNALSNGEDVAPVYFLQLDTVDHNDYATSERQDSIRYRNTVHAICRKHDLPFIAEYADAGEPEMQAASLLTPIYNKFLGLQSAFWHNKDPENRVRCKEEATQCLSTLSTISQNKNTFEISRLESIIHHLPLFTKKIAKPHDKKCEQKMTYKHT